ncbi:17312_t:CDS:2, partial [Gigaspora rosea]
MKTSQQEIIDAESNNSNATQEIVNTLINYTQTHFNTQLLYILEEKNSFLKFALPSNTYNDWIKEEEKSKNINFTKKSGTYINKNEIGSWSEYYSCSRTGSKRIRNDRVEGGASNKKRQIQKESKKVGCECALQVHYNPSNFPDMVVMHYWYKHNGHVPGSRADIKYLRKSEEIINEIKKFARQGLSLSAIRQLMKIPTEIAEGIRQWVDILEENKKTPGNLNNPILSWFQVPDGNRKFQLGFHTPWQFKLYCKYHE